MISFFICLAVLIGGYFVYGKFVESRFAPDDRPTPAHSLRDGVDFEPMPTWRIFLVQFLNIAGLGPIFGAITGALWGPAVYVWIVFGAVFAGAVHDFMIGMLSERNGGASVSEIVGKYMGTAMLWVMRVFSVVLLVMIGVVFMVGPAGLLELLTGWSAKKWTLVILVYYFLATFLPVDKIIGRVYPLFGICLILMAVLVGGATVAHGGARPMLELWDHFGNMHPARLPVWPFMFISVACGAISGFHATQSPIMSRCMKSEREGRLVFCGAMVAEGVIALVWAAASCAFFYEGGDGSGHFARAFAGNSAAVYGISDALLGKVGMVLAVLGVVACPITSGDTAFRSARLTIADTFRISQKGMAGRLCISVPLLGVGYLVSFANYDVVWRYSSWANQTLAMMALWAAAVYLCRFRDDANVSFIAAVPAAFMSSATSAYILQAPEGFGFPAVYSNVAGAAFAAACLAVFLVRVYAPRRSGRLPALSD